MAFLFPESAELINGVRRETGVVVVGVSVDRDATVTDFEAEIDPTHKLRGAVDDGLIPFYGDAFDPFAVAEPADVGPIGGDGIEFTFEFVMRGHRGEVLEDEGDFVAAEDAGESGVEPLPVADFDGEFFVGRELREEGFENGKEVALRFEFRAVEEWELENERAQFFFENGCGVEKFGEVGGSVLEQFVVGNDVGDFEGEKEIGRSLVVPILDGLGAWSAVEGGVDFDGVEAGGVEAEAIRGF